MFRNIRIAPRAALFFGLLGLITLLLGVFAIVQQQRLGTIAGELGKLRLPQVALVGEMRRDFLTMRLYAANFVLSSQEGDKQAALKTVEEAGNNFRNSGNHLSELVGAEGKLKLDEALSIVESYNSTLAQWMQALQAHDSRREQELNNQLTHIGAKAVSAVDALVRFQLDIADLSVAEAESIESSSLYSIILAIVVSIAATSVLAILFSRSLLAPLRLAVETSQRIAAGDLTKDVQDEGKDEAGDMMRAMQQM